MLPTGVTNKSGELVFDPVLLLVLLVGVVPVLLVLVVGVVPVLLLVLLPVFVPVLLVLLPVFVPVLLLAATGTASNNTAHMKHRIRQIKPVFFIIFPRYLIVGLVRPLNLVYNITETLYQFFFFESMRGGIMQ